MPRNNPKKVRAKKAAKKLPLAGVAKSMKTGGAKKAR